MESALESSLSLSSPARRWWRRVLAVAAGAAVLGLAVIVVRIALSSPGDAACDRLDELGGERTVAKLERYVSNRVVRLRATSGYEPVSVRGCRQAMSALSDAMSHKQFARIADCIAAAPSDAIAARCL